VKGASPRFIAESQSWSRKPDSQCNTVYPSYSFPRKEAGGPLSANIYKCALKPIRAADYQASFSADQMRRLRAVFPDGVCDFTKPGVNQTGVVPQIPASP
jgi:hypothetical protein